MKIAIIPTVREIFKNQIELSVDRKIYTLFNQVFKTKCSYKILNGHNDLKNEKILIMLGGNNIINVSKKKNDKYRSILDNKYYHQAQKHKIKILGICHGAQFIGSKFGAKLIKTNSHNKKHMIKFENKLYNVNSYHNFKIVYKGKKIESLGLGIDNSIEYFKIPRSNIYGIMWHPERFKSIRKFDLKILKSICN